MTINNTETVPTRTELADALAARIAAEIDQLGQAKAASLTAIASAVTELRRLDPDRYDGAAPYDAASMLIAAPRSQSLAAKRLRQAVRSSA